VSASELDFGGRFAEDRALGTSSIKEGFSLAPRAGVEGVEEVSTVEDKVPRTV